jgi:hypothetical protein
MSKSNTLETQNLQYIFNATPPSWDAATDLYLSLHTANPTDAGTQLTSEATYTGYARIPVARTAGGWTVAGDQATNAALVQFPQCTGGSSLVTHIAIGTALSGAGQIMLYGALSSPLSISNGIQPQFNAGTLVVTED